MTRDGYGSPLFFMKHFSGTAAQTFSRREQSGKSPIAFPLKVDIGHAQRDGSDRGAVAPI